MLTDRRERLWASVLLLLVWSRRGFRAKYSQTLLGGLWSIAQPAGMTVAFVFLLDRVDASPDSHVPYASFVFPGMLCWLLFANGVNGAVQGVAMSMPIIAKVRFPRLVAPVSGALLPIVEFLLAAVFLPVLLIAQGTGHTPKPFSILLAIAGTLVLSVGVGTLLGAVAVFLRDLRNALPFILQLLLLTSPVIYAADRLPEVLRWNPMATYISLFRSGLVDTAAPNGSEVVRAFCVTAVLLGVGVWYFRAVEDRFADVA